MTKGELSQKAWSTAARVLQEAMECEGEEKYGAAVCDHICCIVVPHLASIAARVERGKRKRKVQDEDVG